MGMDTSYEQGYADFGENNNVINSTRKTVSLCWPLLS